MPCSDGSCHDDGRYEIGQLNRKVNDLTRLLCMACQGLGTFQRGNTGIPELQSWWEVHQAEDRRRIEHEKGEAGRQRVARISNMKREVELMESRMAADKAKAAAYRAELEKLEGKS